MAILNERTNNKALEIILYVQRGIQVSESREINSDLILAKITRPMKIIENFGFVNI